MCRFPCSQEIWLCRMPSSVVSTVSTPASSRAKLGSPSAKFRSIAVAFPRLPLHRPQPMSLPTSPPTEKRRSPCKSGQLNSDNPADACLAQSESKATARWRNTRCTNSGIEIACVSRRPGVPARYRENSVWTPRDLKEQPSSTPWDLARLLLRRRESPTQFQLLSPMCASLQEALPWRLRALISSTQLVQAEKLLL